MALPTFTMRQLLEAGVHFGHNTRRWNPKMAPYLFGVRNKIHIIDLEKTVPLLHQAMVAVRDVVAAGGRVLFVGTKRQAAHQISEAAKRCGQYYVNHRWLGGMMTNWRTISNSIKRLRDLDEQLAGETVGLTKKELLGLTRERAKLERALGGIKEMGALPDILMVIDTNKEAIAVAEANKLNIPVVGIIDSNSKPEGIDFPVPGNDDAIRAIDLYCELMVGAVLNGIQQEVTSAGEDLGKSPEGPVEKLPNEVKQPVKPKAKSKKPEETAQEKAQEKGEQKAEEKSQTKTKKPVATKGTPATRKEPVPAKKKEPVKTKKSEPEKMAKKDPPAAKEDDEEGGKKHDVDKGKEKDEK
jgi:small subunit ribosomal protein S2